MEFIAVIGIIVGLIALYFFIGVALRFLWGWWILVTAVPLSIYVGVAYGWAGAISGIVGLCVALYANNEWHDSPTFLAISDKIDSAFYFKDT